MMPADAPATTPPDLADLLSPELALVIEAELAHLDPALGETDLLAAAVARHLARGVTFDVPEWFIRLDGLVDADVYPAAVRDDIRSALRLIAELQVAVTRWRRERDGALRGAHRALLAQRDAQDTLAVALLAADDSLTPQHPAEDVAALKEAAKAARAVVNAADDSPTGVIGSGDAAMTRLGQSLAAVNL